MVVFSEEEPFDWVYFIGAVVVDIFLIVYV